MGIDRLLAGILVVGIFQGCRPEAASTGFPEINPLEITESVRELDDYVQRLEPIALETPDSIVVADITKLLLDRGGNFVLMAANRIYKFSERGEFQLQYGNVGRGPGEYTAVFDICLNREQNQLWCLNHVNDVLKYDLASGEYLETVTTRSGEMKIPPAAALIPGEGDGFYLYVPNPDDAGDLTVPFYCLKRFDKKGKPVGEELLRTDFNIGMNPIAFVTQNWDKTYLLRPQENENICYCISDSGLSEKVKIHFGLENVPPLFSFRDGRNPWLNLEKFMACPYYKNPFHILETKTQMFLSALGPGNGISYFVIDKATMRGINWSTADELRTTPFFIVGSDEEAFYGIFDKYLAPGENSVNSDPMLSYLVNVRHLHLEEADNPIIVRIRFK